MAYKYSINPHTGKLQKITDPALVEDLDADGIIDKAESLDDGDGNTASAVDTKDAIDKKHTQNTDKYLTTDVTKVLYVDKNRTDTYTENGTITKPFSMPTRISTYINAVLQSVCFFLDFFVSI